MKSLRAGQLSATSFVVAIKEAVVLVFVCVKHLRSETGEKFTQVFFLEHEVEPLAHDREYAEDPECRQEARKGVAKDKLRRLIRDAQGGIL